MNSLPDSFGKNSIWFFLWGIALLVLGVIAISVSGLTTLISIVFLGFIIFIGGIVILLDTFKWWRSWGGFLLHLIIGILYLAVGLVLIENPVEGSISLTFLLGIFYICIGVFRMAYSLTTQAVKWGWSFFSGFISLLLGLLILGNWPASSLFIIGLFVGIDLIFCGWTYIMLALTARSLSKL